MYSAYFIDGNNTHSGGRTGEDAQHTHTSHVVEEKIGEDKCQSLNVLRECRNQPYTRLSVCC